MANLAKQKEKFSVPEGTDIVLFLKNLQHWAIEHEHEEIRRVAREVQEAYQGLHEGIIQNANLMLLVQHEIDNTCEQVQLEHRERVAIAECHYMQSTWKNDYEFSRRSSAWEKMVKGKLENLQSLNDWHVRRYWSAWEKLFEKLDIVIRSDRDEMG